ncbi:MAG TPA: fructose-bisphosphate aldolase [Verrucomicrobiae bacterium]|nr:fructose-bisphosphate aldolase [Verrucomicrobiae bacterium]
MTITALPPTSAARSGPPRTTLDDLDLPLGKKARLHTLLHDHGPGNGTLLLLPIDQGLEHGPMDFFVNPPALDPDFQCQLALHGGYSGIAFQIGLASRYLRPYAGRVPLVLKLNGKTNVPAGDDPISPLTATVEDAVRLGASAVGYTLYVGSPAQDRDLRQMQEVRAACDRTGMPLICWAYPRGAAIEQRGGQTSLYAVDYAARVAAEMGADVIKLNMPQPHGDADRASPAPYDTLVEDRRAMLARVIRSAGRSLVIFAGGSKLADDQLLGRIEDAIAAGATGFIFGRNMWQRPMDQALAMTARVREVLLRGGS